MPREGGHIASAGHREYCYSIAFAEYGPCTISECGRTVVLNDCFWSQIQYVVSCSPNDGDVPPKLGGDLGS